MIMVLAPSHINTKMQKLVKLFVCFFLSSCRVLFLSKATVMASGHTNETDQEALLIIKHGVEQDPLQVLDSWNSSLRFCRWQGVQCGNKNQRVVTLELPRLHLGGTLSPYIGNLTLLRVLDLTDNNFRGSIPQQVASLPRLQVLVLSNNSFQGTLPTNLTSLPKLETLYLSNNNLSGRIPAELGSLMQLRGLELWGNHFTGTIPPSLGNLSSLTVLSLLWNNLQGGIPSEFGRLQNLGFLQLGNNYLSGALPAQIYNISSLYYLAVAYNSFQGQLPPSLGLDLPNLQVFVIGGNQFSGSIPKSLANASKLTELAIQANNFNTPPPLNLGTLKHLESLYLSANPIFSRCKSQCRLSFFSSLTNCTNLAKLELAQTNLTGAFPDVITNLSTSLTYLLLDINSLSGQIPQGIGNLYNLISLYLFDNKLSGVIPDSIGYLTKLQQLRIGTNNLSGKIPASVGNLSLLGILDLCENMLEGDIPGSLGNCKLLQGVDLSFNNLTGKIPEQVVSLPSLSIGLYLGWNSLTGPLPPEVGSLKNVQQLSMQGNQLSGAIPSTLGSCELLEYLDMGSNLFEGTIPSTFQQLRGIRFLNLSRNNLSGEIPEFLAEIASLNYIDLSYHKFEGQVPQKGVFVNVSAFLFFGNRGLCGGIPQLQLPPCAIQVSSKPRKHFAAAAIVFPIIGGVACIVLSAFVYWRRKQRRQEVSPSSLPVLNQYCDLSYLDLVQATGHFSSNNLLGKGGFGSVYRGTLSAGELLAVKVFNLNVRGANKSFLVECQALKNIRHRNLVKIISACSSIDFKGQEFKALIYEFMPNGNLDSWLHQESSSGLEGSHGLDLTRRLSIAIDVANALKYLHHDCQEPVIHCDLKPSNILLDKDLVAHVGDFGLARLVVQPETAGRFSEESETSSIGVAGTVGYIAPEYTMSREVSSKGDVYSYGIILLELFTGKRPTDAMFSGDLTLRSFVKTGLLSDEVMQIVDARLLLINEEAGEEQALSSSNNAAFWRGTSSKYLKIKEGLKSILHIGLMCSAESPGERTDIRDAIKELVKLNKLLDS